MTSTGARRRPQKYPDELRERAIRMVLEIREETGEKHGTITRVAKELGVGAESLRHWVNRAVIDSGWPTRLGRERRGTPRNARCAHHRNTRSAMSVGPPAHIESNPVVAQAVGVTGLVTLE